LEKDSVYMKIKSRRTIRKYLQTAVPEEVLLKCVEAAIFSPSGGNLQPLRYVIVNNAKLLNQVFSTLSWAVYLPDYGPTKEEMPRAYIVLLLDKNGRTPTHDASIASMSISMVAYDPESLDVALVVALGYPAKNPVVEPVSDGKINYWLDKNGVLHVPKRDIKDIVRWNNC